jgi:hypothetical protein
MKPRNLLMGPGVFLLAFSCGTVPQERERFDIRFMTWGSFPFKRDVLEDAANQKILHAIRKEYKSGFEISAETSVPLDSVVQRIERLSQCDLVATGEAPSGKWLANVPIFDEKEILRAEKTSLKYARKEAEILKRALPDVRPCTPRCPSRSPSIGRRSRGSSSERSSAISGSSTGSGSSRNIGTRGFCPSFTRTAADGVSRVT